MREWRLREATSDQSEIRGIVTVCTHCGEAAPAGARFCPACGAAQIPGRQQTDRKVVTIVFCDLVGSTSLGERLDPEALHNVLTAYYEAVSAVIERHGGTVQKFAGDAVMAAFGIRELHEDDALRAVRAAAEVRAEMPAVASDIGITIDVRIGVNTGIVVADGSSALALGDAVNVAARLEQAAQPGEIVLGDDTLVLVRDAVLVEAMPPLTLKGKSEPVIAHRLLEIDRQAPGSARRFDIPMVNRVSELAVLQEMWGRCVEKRRCELATLVGAAGVGKSRLAAEFLGAVEGEALVLSGRCLPYGEGITFFPLTEALRGVAEAAKLLPQLAAGGFAAPEELFLSVRSLLEDLAVTQPVVLHIDDLQWAEPMLLDLIDNVRELSRQAPVMLLCGAREETAHGAIERWETGAHPATTIRLGPLGDSECVRLLEELDSSDDPLPSATRSRVIATSEGNPLFLLEMATLARQGGDAGVPPTIQALLAARLDRLAPASRELLARGAIEGEVFNVAALRELAPEVNQSEIETLLQGLVRESLIRPAVGALDGGAYRFSHLLIRDAAYERLTKRARAELHARYASWLERAPGDLIELDEIAGWHLEQAAQRQMEVHRRADTVLMGRAATRLYAAARGAEDRSDAAAALKLCERALSLAEPDPNLHAKVGLSLAERLIEAGELARADSLLVAVEHEGDDLHAAWTLTKLEWLFHTQPHEAIDLLEPMLEELTQRGDDRGVARAHWLAFLLAWRANRAAPAAEHVRLSALHATRAGAAGLSARAIGWYVATLIYGPADADQLAAELGQIEAGNPGPYVRACVELGKAEVARLSERFDEASRLASSAHGHFRELGMHMMGATCAHAIADIELSTGHPDAALAALNDSEAILSEFGERPLRSTTQVWLALAQERLEAPAAALAAADLADSLSAPEDVFNFATTAGVRARLALVQGDSDAAERWARRAVDLAAATDFVRTEAVARLGLGQILAALGQWSAAAEQARLALAAYDAKGDRGGAAAARALLSARAA